MRLSAVIFFCFIHAIQAAYLNIDTNGNVKSPTNFPKFLLLSGNNFTAEPTNTPGGWAIRGHASGGGGSTNWSAGNTTSVRIAVVSKGTNGTGAIKTISVSGTATITEEGDTNLVIGAGGGSGGDQFSGGTFVLSNLAVNPYTDYTNKAMQVAANNVLSNLQTMAFFYWTNAQASAMLLSNLVNNPYTGYTNKAMQVAANNVLSNFQTMATFYWTNAQASAMLLSNLVNNPYTGYTNQTFQVAANNVLSNLQTMASFYWTNAQASAMRLSNLVNNPVYDYTNRLVQGANITLVTNADWTVTIAASLPGGGGDQYSQGVFVLSNLTTMASFYWTNSQASAMLLSNLVSNPYIGYTNKAMQVAANNVLSNLQSMASFYWTNSQASAMLLSNLVNNPYTGYTNLTFQIAANNVLSNIQTMASFYWTNSQASSMVLSNLVNNPYTGFTNKAMQVAANNVLSNLQSMTSFYWTNGQASAMLLSNIVNNPNSTWTNTLVQGANITLTTNAGGTVTIASTGGSGSPGGTEAMIQYNKAGAFAGATNAHWDETNRVFTVDNLSVRTNLNIATLNTPVLNVTNDITASNAAVGWATVTNALSVNLITNIGNVKWQPVVPAITQSNLVVSFNTNRYLCEGLTNIILTNIVEELHATVSADVSIFVRNTNSVNCALVWPSYGAQHGYFFRTNIYNPVLAWAAVTNGKSAVVSLTCWGTNVFATITEWP